MNVKERLKEYIKFSDMTVKAFELSIDVSNGYVNNMQKSIGIDKLQEIIEKYSNLNLEWLITGKGEMIRSTVKTIEEPEEKLQSVNESDEGMQNGKSLLQIISNKDDVILKQMEIISSLLQPITTTLRIQDKKLGELDSFAEMLKLYYKIEIEENEIKEAIALEKKGSVKR